MPKIKSHKTVEQIAKKHRLDVSFIQKQLDMGEPIEHEHTKDHQLAMNIALQHLDEIPDYYTRLKKMEADAKKEHKKFKDIKEEDESDMDVPMHSIHIEYDKRYCPKCKKVQLRSQCKYGPTYWDIFSIPSSLKEATMQEEQRYCPLCNKRETRSECSYGEKSWDKVSVKDEEYSMVRSELKTMQDAIKRLRMTVGKGEGNLEAWVQSKITKAADYIDTAADYVTSGEMKEQKIVDKILDEVLGEGKKKGLWDNIHAKRKRGERPAKPGEEGYPKTLDIDEDLKQARKNVGASKCWDNKKIGNSPTKMKGGKEVPNCVAKENVSIEDLNGNTFAEVVDIIKPEPIKGFKSQVTEATRIQAQTGNVIAVTLSWRGKYYSLKIFFPQVKTPTRKEITDELQKVYPGCAVIHHTSSEIQSGQPLIQIGLQGGSSGTFGPNKKYVKPYGEQVEFDEDWQSANRKDRTDGLSQKAVNAYRRENPGSKLQTAVTEKNPSGKRAQRRKNFCSRMSGMKKRLTSAETARDPDSRINKALRRWNCN